jgi:hypothetical protein
MSSIPTAADIEVRIVSEADVEPSDELKIRRLVLEDLASRRDEPYYKAQVEVERTPEGNPEALTVSLLSSRSYSAHVFRVQVDHQFNTISVEALP